MKATLSIAAALAAMFISTSAGAQDQGKVYDEDINPAEQIDAAVAEAKSEGKFVIAQLGGNWCPWCVKFAGFVKEDSEIAGVIAENFNYIHVNYNPRKSAGEEKAEQTAQALAKLGNPTRFGFPVLVVLDGEGNVLHFQDSSYLESEGSYDKDKVLRFLKNWTPGAVGK